MSRRRALGVVLASALGVGITGVIVGGLALAAARFEGEGVVAGLIAVGALLATLAFLIAVLVLMYALYALARGPSPRPDDER